jgi:L-asparaginase
VMLDEFDKLEKYPQIAEAIVAQLRSAKQRSSRPGAEGSLTLTLCGVKPPESFFLDDPEAHPLRGPEGEKLWLDDFEWELPDTIQVVASGFPAGMAHSLEFAREALRFAGGFPQPCMWLCKKIAEDKLVYSTLDVQRDLEQLIDREQASPAGPPAFFTDTQTYLTSHSRSLATEALQLYVSLLGGSQQRVSDTPAEKLLRWSGLARLDRSDSFLRTRCDLMSQWFDRTRTFGILRGVQRSSRLGSSVDRPRVSAKRICILAAGGTIGMREGVDGTVRATDDLDSLLEDVDQIAKYHVEHVTDLDSADITPRHWEEIARKIAALRKDFQGFVVTHGTDTLAYSASAVAFALGRDLTFPVVLTGAPAPIDVAHGDARTNLVRAALVAVQDIPEVVVCFGEYIFRACRTQKRDDRRFDAFESPAYPPLGYVAEDVELLPQNFRKNVGEGPLRVRARFSDGIMAVAQTPGAFGSFYEAALAERREDGQRRCRGIVIQSLGVGNVPSKYVEYSLLPQIENAQKLHIPVVLTSQ